jgi:hypothetical protein
VRVRDERGSDRLYHRLQGVEAESFQGRHKRSPRQSTPLGCRLQRAWRSDRPATVSLADARFDPKWRDLLRHQALRSSPDLEGNRAS